MKKQLRILYLKFSFRNINYRKLNYSIYFGRFFLIRTDKNSIIEFNQNIFIHNFVSILAEDGGKISLGDTVNIGDYSTIRASRAEISIGSNTMLGQNVMLISTNHKFIDKSKLIRTQDIDENKKGIRIGEDCWLGAGSIILPGVTIGNGVVVGASAVVTKNIPDYAIVVGNPARVLKYRE